MIEFRNEAKAKINNNYKPPEKIAADREHVYKRYNAMKNGRSDGANGNLEEQWDRWERMYEAWRPNRNADDWHSNIVPPFTTTIVERCLAEIIDQTLRPKAAARGPEDIPRAKLMNHTIDHTWYIGDGDLELYASLKQTLILGNAVWQEDYWRDRRMVKQMKKFNLDTNEEEYVEKEVDDFDDVYGENVNIRNFFRDPMSHTINRGRFKANDCIRRYIMNLDTFMEQFKGSIYDQFGATKYVQAGGESDQFQYYTPPEGIDKENQVEVLFYWGRRPDKLIIVANDVVIRDGPNPYAHKQLPFAEARDVPRMNTWKASGEPKLLESIQSEMETLRRMRIDRQHMDLWKMFLVSNRDALDEEEAIIRPSSFLEVDDPRNSIVPLEYKDINPSAYREEEALRQDGREVTGVASPQPSSTATEAAIFKETTMRALRMKIWLISRELLGGIVRLRAPNIAQFYSEPRVSKMVGETKWRRIRTMDVALDIDTKNGNLIEKKSKGENFFFIEPSMITPQYGKFDFILTGEPSLPISKPLQQQKMTELMSNPIMISALEQGHYDVGLMADKLVEIHEMDPEDLKAAPEGAEQPAGAVDEEQLLELANRENERITAGKQVPGTPFANQGHIDIHKAYMDSDAFKQAVGENKGILQTMVEHILFEQKAMESRGQGNAQAQLGQGRLRKSMAAGIEGGEAKATNPGKVLGPELSPAGQ